MLEEFKTAARQPETPGYRRRFSDAVMELIVWYSPAGVVRGFQLCYDRDGTERAFTWHVDAGMAHTDAAPRAKQVLAQFRERSARLEPGLAELVERKLGEYGRSHLGPL